MLIYKPNFHTELQIISLLTNLMYYICKPAHVRVAYFPKESLC